MKAEKKELILNGDLKDALLNGATIEAIKHDKFDYLVLVRLPKGNKWKFARYETINFGIGKNEFRLMCEYNCTLTQARKYFKNAWIEAIGNNTRIIKNSK